MNVGVAFTIAANLRGALYLTALRAYDSLRKIPPGRAPRFLRSRRIDLPVFTSGKNEVVKLHRVQNLRTFMKIEYDSHRVRVERNHPLSGLGFAPANR
jgi:hypothetical protein